MSVPGTGFGARSSGSSLPTSSSNNQQHLQQSWNSTNTNSQSTLAAYQQQLHMQQLAQQAQQAQQVQQVLESSGIYLPAGTNFASLDPTFQKSILEAAAMQQRAAAQAQAQQHQHQLAQAAAAAQQQQQPLHQMSSDQLVQLFARSFEDSMTASSASSPMPAPLVRANSGGTGVSTGAEIDMDGSDSSVSDSEGSDYGMTDDTDGTDGSWTGPGTDNDAYRPTARERREAQRGNRPRKTSIASVASASTGGSYDEAKANAANQFAVTTTDDPERPYQCQYPGCGRRFTRRADCLRHVKIHLDERPFACPDCPKRFIQRHALVVHMRKHTGERPFECDLCDRKFTESSSLTRHRRIHTQERPFGCPICNKHFTRKSTLQRHIDRHNSGTLGRGGSGNFSDDESDAGASIEESRSPRGLGGHSPQAFVQGHAHGHGHAHSKRGKGPAALRMDALDLGPADEQQLNQGGISYSALSSASSIELPTIMVMPPADNTVHPRAISPHPNPFLSPTSPTSSRSKPAVPARPAGIVAQPHSHARTPSYLGHTHSHLHHYNTQQWPIDTLEALLRNQQAGHDHSYHPLAHPFVHDESELLSPTEPARAGHRERSRSAPTFGIDVTQLAAAIRSQPSGMTPLEIATTLAGHGIDAFAMPQHTVPTQGLNFGVNEYGLHHQGVVSPPTKGIEEFFDVEGRQGS